MSMGHPLLHLIERRVRYAESQGEFENLPGAGKPLPPCDDPENAVINRLLKENGAVPEIVAWKRRQTQLRHMLKVEPDRAKKSAIVTELSMLEAKIEIARKLY